jgi:hypothetical protein
MKRWAMALLLASGSWLMAQEPAALPPIVTELLDATLADGFDDPLAESEDKRVVRSMGAGEVCLVQREGDLTRVWLQHRFVENGQVRMVWSGYGPLRDCDLVAGAEVKRREGLGRLGRRLELGEEKARDGFTFELRSVAPTGVDPPEVSLLEPSDFIRARRKLLVPAREELIVIAVKRDHQIHVCKNGKVTATYFTALGQDPVGPKLADGDNKTPEGDYRILQKAEGPFDGEWGQYLGAAWLRLSYPNAFDAQRALAEERITAAESAALVKAANSGRLPSAETALGGGIGIHGWISDWSTEHPEAINLTWGCLSLRQADLLELYRVVEVGTRVILHP